MELPMANSFCRVQLMGFTGAAPTISALPDGKLIASISVAVHSSVLDSAHNRYVEQTEWHHVVAFQKKAEDIRDTVKKGCRVYIEGTLHTYRWRDNTMGRIVTRTRIVVSDCTVLSYSNRGQDTPHRNSVQPVSPTLPQSSEYEDPFIGDLPL